jgi:hypothetical protein
MPRILDPFRFVLIAVAGWMNQHQLQIVDYLREENRVLRADNWKRPKSQRLYLVLEVWAGRTLWRWLRRSESGGVEMERPGNEADQSTGQQH